MSCLQANVLTGSLPVRIQKTWFPFPVKALAYFCSTNFDFAPSMPPPSEGPACSAFAVGYREMFYTYVLISETDGDFYIGYAQDLKKRFEEHQLGKVLSTAPRRPLKLVYYEACLDEKDAIAREKSLKTGYGRKYIKRRIANHLSS